MDSRFNNYPQRLEYAKFLERTSQRENAISYLEKLLEEFDQMTPGEQKNKQSIKNTIKSYILQYKKL